MKNPVISFMCKKAQKSVIEIYRSFEHLLDKARTLYSNSERLKKLSIDQADEITKSSSAMAEISSMLERTVSNTDQLKSTAEQAMNSLETGKANVHSVNSALAEIKEASEELNQIVHVSLAEFDEITKTMAEIKSKTLMINEIVFQTKLLSFNASVEAARAGEAGKGFAVVAEEMSRLAQSSGKASQEIEKILALSTENTQQILLKIKTALEEGTQKSIQLSENAVSLGQDSEARFGEIAQSVEETQKLVDSIYEATQEQSLGVQEVAKTLEVLTQSSSELSQISQVTYNDAVFISENTSSISESVYKLGEQIQIKIRPQQKKFDFNAAVNAHIDWKMKLTKYMQKPDRSLNADHVCQDNQCALGKWIYGDGQEYAQSQKIVFENLKHSHADFHKTAGDIIRLIDSKQIDKVQNMMQPYGEYSKVSEKTVALIKELQSHAQEEDLKKAS